MCRTLLHLFLLAVGVTAAQGNAQGQDNSTDPICSAGQHEVGEGEVKTIPFTPPSSKNPTLYVLPEEDFQGITVVAQGQDQTEEAWFPLGDKCTSANSSWWKTHVYVHLATSSKPLRFLVKSGECSLKCYSSGTFERLNSIQVKARGHSHWNTTLTTSCTAVNYAEASAPNHSVCQKPLSNSSTPNSDRLILVAAVVGVGLIVVALVVALVVACRRKQHRTAESSSPATELTQTQGRPNSLYEPCSEFQNIPGVQGPSRHDSVNSLYQPCIDFQNVAGPSEQTGSKRDSRNSLYEPFSKFQNVTGHAEHRV